MNIGDKVTVTRDGGYHIGGWVWEQVNGKVGTIVDADDGFFDWVVKFDGTTRQGGEFAFFEASLEKADK